MGWPMASQYQEAVQNPSRALRDPELKHAVIECDSLQLPKARTGNFAVVFKATVSGRAWSVKCFTREGADQEQRYEAIHRELKGRRLPFAVEFDYQREGILVNGKWYPILRMEWVRGVGLVDYITNSLSVPARLKCLADSLVAI